MTIDNDTVNALNTYFRLVITHEQFNNIPQLPRYVGNTLDTSSHSSPDM